MTVRARSKYSPERGVRSVRRRCSRSVRAAMRPRSMVDAPLVVVSTGMWPAYRGGGSALLAQRRPADLAARGLGELGGEVDDAGVLVGGGLRLDVLLQGRGEVLGGSEP